MTSAGLRKNTMTVVLLASVARLCVVFWAARVFPPTADGTYFHLLATRLATGQGYTWLWPDGVVTPAAHYPVGYPALLALVYVAFGTAPIVAMLLNAAIGVAAAWAAHDLLLRATTPRLALAGGIVVALHPALVPYTAALMTEGVTAALVLVAVSFAARARDATSRGLVWLAASGVTLGVATLVRPQIVAMAPFFGWYAVAAATHGRRRFACAVAVTALALMVCAPWTVRNCTKMGTCALVSVNGGWNLAIGTQTEHGGWQEIAVPAACKEVFDEAKKDACFGREAKRVIVSEPGQWLARVPAKLRMTFDYFGAAPWYLHAANPNAFPEGAKFALGAVETVVCRLLLLAALVAVRALDGPRRLIREATTGVGLLSCFVTAGALGYVACGLGVLLLGQRALERLPVVVPAAAIVVLSTAVMHGIFFGAGRYGLLVVPLVAMLGFVSKPGVPSVRA